MLKRKLKFWRVLSVYVAIALGVMAAFSLGCSSLKIENFHSHRLKIHELELLKTGYESFVQSDYEKASEIYDDLYKESQNSDIKRRALYGLACTRLITAENSLEHEKAIQLWDKWMNSVPDVPSSEDPRLLAPYVEMTAPPCQKEAEIQLLIEKINSLEQEILTLRHQISSLEAIDQKIEEKKKQISSP